MLVVAGAAALTVHAKKPQTVVLKQTSSTNKPVSKPTTTAPTPDSNSTPTQPVTSPGSSTSESGSSESQQNSATDQALNSALSQLSFQITCGQQAGNAFNTYSNALAQAGSTYTSTYNTEVDNWEAEEGTTNAPPVDLQNDFWDDATSAYNAIADPAWTTYSNIASSLTSQGCTNVPSAGSEPNGL